MSNSTTVSKYVVYQPATETPENVFHFGHTDSRVFDNPEDAYKAAVKLDQAHDWAVADIDIIVLITDINHIEKEAEFDYSDDEAEMLRNAMKDVT